MFYPFLKIDPFVRREKFVEKMVHLTPSPSPKDSILPRSLCNDISGYRSFWYFRYANYIDLHIMHFFVHR